MDISEEAYRWVRKNKKTIIDKFIGNTPPTDSPVSFFMAGSPGAGKTEYAKSFIKDLNKVFQEKYNKDYPIVRIDADEVRLICPGYDGNNASLFQRASILGVNKLHDYVLKKRINFLLDGTFANKDYAVDNARRSIEERRKVQIFYIFQDPLNAWELTMARQIKEGRIVPMEVFIKDYFSAKKVVNEVKAMFSEKVLVDLIIKDYLNNEQKIYFNISDIDSYIKLPYTEETLRSKLLEINEKLFINGRI